LPWGIAGSGNRRLKREGHRKPSIRVCRNRDTQDEVMRRAVEPELLDELPGNDPRAVQSRRDLQRLNGWMGNAATVADALRSAFRERAPGRLVELGSGDGSFILRVARRLAPDWPGVHVELLDRQSIVMPETRDALDRLGWRTEIVTSDVFDWLQGPVAAPYDVVVANLFLHHFTGVQLSELLRGAARRARVFVAVEPRRSAWVFASSCLVWFIGCNEVTRHDAPVSVRAGFAGPELSQLWPADGTWSLEEGRAGLFGQLFTAQSRPSTQST
jgi:hypothetical protein